MVSANGDESKAVCSPETVQEEIHQNLPKHGEDRSNGNGNNAQAVGAKQSGTSENGKKMNADQMRLQFAAICEGVPGLDENVKTQSLHLFEKTRSLISTSVGVFVSGTEEQMVRMWSACTLYCALILSSGSSEIPACKLSHILHNNNLSIGDFFKELPVFLQRTNSILQAEYGTVCDRLKQVQDLQASFTHLAVLFNFYRRNYNIFFLSSRMTNCSSSHSTAYGTAFTCDHLRFGWMLFLALSKHILTQFDLVTCTNGLIAILIIMIVHVPAHRRKFSSFKTDMFAGRGPNGTNVVGSLCQLYEASEEDVQKMMDKANDMIGRVLKISPTSLPLNDSEQLADIDTERLTYFESLMGESSMCLHLEMLNKDYEDVFKQKGELDERVFLDGGDAVLSLLPESSSPALGEISNNTSLKRKDDVMMMSPVKGYSIKGNLLSPPCSPKPSPMKASSKMLPPTPISSTMTSAKWLRTVIAPLSAEPSSELLHFFQSCDTDITRQVKLRAQILLEAIFSSERRVNWGICRGIAGLSSMDSTWAEQRRLEALKLYYRVVGSMCHAESQRLKCENLSALLINERFHRCMLACSAELVLATYKTVSLNFPAVLEPTGITAFDVWKVIESFVRHEETLPRELKRHLNSIEEKILEKLAWEKGSSLYNSLIIAKPALQECINRLRLLAEPMPSLESLNARYQIIDGSTRAELLQGDTQVCFSSPVKPSLSNGSTFMEKAFLSPERKISMSAGATAMTRARAPLQAAFASPQRLSHVGGGETCAEAIINIFLHKVLKLAAIRIKILCESLKQPNHIMEDVYRTVQYIVQNETSLFFKRHVDQLILCAMYGVCKVKQLNVTFKQIIQHYRQNPHDSYIFRTVYFTEKPLKGGQGTGDIISFYNAIFVPVIKSFLVTLSPQTSCHIDDPSKAEIKPPGSPVPSPFSSLPDMSPKKVSAKHNVYVSPLRSSKIEPLRPHSSRSLYACVGESTHAYQSPSKDLAEINSRVNANSRRIVKLEFGDATGLVNDSMTAGNLLKRGSGSDPDSLHPSKSRTAGMEEGPAAKRLCMDR